MRVSLRAVGLAALMAAVGCHRDKYNMQPVRREEAVLPPNEKRYNEPDTAGYRKPKAEQPKDDKAMMSRPGGFGGPGNPGGF